MKAAVGCLRVEWLRGAFRCEDAIKQPGECIRLIDLAGMKTIGQDHAAAEYVYRTSEPGIRAVKQGLARPFAARIGLAVAVPQGDVPTERRRFCPHRDRRQQARHRDGGEIEDGRAAWRERLD